MNKLLLAAGIAAFVSSTSALAQAIAPATPGAKQPATRAATVQRVQRQFARLDANRDGFLTQAEQQASAQRPKRAAPRRQARDPGARFNRLDTNRDGQLSRAEFDAGRAFRSQRMAAKRPRRTTGLFGRMFTMADANRDGRVSLQEATTASLTRFDRADLNRDGTITADERRRRRAARQR